jgi:hypothetical protein
MDILRLMATRDIMAIAPDAERTITDMFASVRTKPDFGNDRFVRTLYEQARMHQAGRLMHLGGRAGQGSGDHPSQGGFSCHIFPMR